MTPEPLLKLAGTRLTFEYQSGAVTRVEPGHTTGWRTLPCLLTACITCDSTISFRDRTPVSVRSGQTLCIRPNIFHRIDVPGDQSGISRWSHTAFRILEGVDLFYWLDTSFVIEGRTSRRIGQVNQTLAELGRTPKQDLRLVARRNALGFELLALVAERSTIKPDIGVWMANHPGWTETLEYIARNLASPLDIPSLAKKSNLSVSRFHHTFLEKVGKPPGQYIRDLRLERARQLLISHDHPVKKVAELTGYEDVFHFSRIFKKHCGASPARFREQIRQSKM